MGWQVELDGDGCTRRPGLARARRHRHRHRLEDLARAARGPALRPRRLPLAPPLGARRPRPRVGFEGFFRLPNGRPPLLRVHEVDAGKAKISTLTAGSGLETAILIHGLGGTKSSFYETVSALASEYTVHAIDLPGFGASSKPARAPYDPAWFARAVVRFMDELGIKRAHLVGNSLGGRVAIEVGLTAPDRVRSLSLLTPSLAWRKRREFVPLVKLLRPELAAIPHKMSSHVVRRQFWSMFGRPERLHPSVADLAVEEFVAGYRNHAARVAFSSAARNIYLEEPNGPDGFYERLSQACSRRRCSSGATRTRWSRSPSARHVTEALPDARQVVLNECGHVPAGRAARGHQRPDRRLHGERP